MKPDNRWRLLLSCIGALITLSAIAAELSGYFRFLSNLNSAFNIAIESIYPIGGVQIIGLKLLLVVMLIWSLFYTALREYSRKTEDGELEKWINQVKVLLRVTPSEKQNEIRRTKLALFLRVPIKALLMTISPKWPGKRIFVVSGLQIHLWPFMAEVLFAHALAVFGIMGLYLGFKIVNSLI